MIHQGRVLSQDSLVLARDMKLNVMFGRDQGSVPLMESACQYGSMNGPVGRRLPQKQKHFHGMKCNLLLLKISHFVSLHKLRYFMACPKNIKITIIYGKH